MGKHDVTSEVKGVQQKYRGLTRDRFKKAAEAKISWFIIPNMRRAQVDTSLSSIFC